ncbi:MAG: CCA tRNA nucleotidyltransferase [Bryobacterales bacterium]|nr:CCA tRNA nucleotidyltransferase [Bryobacterales bacterium]
MRAEASRTLALESLADLRRAGFQAWLVGGCVRDRLLGREPGDYDIATNARPEEIGRIFLDAIAVGASFGVMLRRNGEAQAEIATFRSEGEYADGRRPDAVVFEDTPEGDSRRRDFTVNALYEDPSSGTVLDFHGGLEDLARKQIRSVGEPARRFAEDHLRMMRAVRFAVRLGFRIEAETAAAIREHAAHIRRIAAERVRDEFSRILTEGGARRGMELLDELGLLAGFLPEAARMKGVAQPPEFHPEGDVWVHTLGMLELLEQPSLTLALGVLFHDIGKPETQTVTDRIRFNGHVEAGMRIAREAMERLRYGGAEIEQVQALVAGHMKFMHLDEMRQSTLKRFLGQPHFEEHLELHRADCLSSHGKLENYAFAREALERFGAEELHPEPLLRGADLIAGGYRPSPRFGAILRALEEERLEGRLLNRQDALDWVRREFPVDEEDAR